MILWVTAAGQAASAGIFSGGCSNADGMVYYTVEKTRLILFFNHVA